MSKESLKISEMRFHPLAEIFPMMQGDSFKELVADIKANGLREEIWTHENMIVDGRNRQRACIEADVEPRYRQWDRKGDLVAFIASLNLRRRHLTPSQKAMVGGRIRDIYDKQAKERQKNHAGTAPGLPKNTSGNFTTSDSVGRSRDLAGKAVGVSGSYIDHATKVLKTGTPELIKSVDEGRMNVTTAAILATEPPEVQKKECAKPKRNRIYGAGIGGSRNVDDNAQEESHSSNGKSRPGVGIDRANEAINCLTRIPKNDTLRKRGFQLVTDWIRRNK